MDVSRHRDLFVAMAVVAAVAVTADVVVAAIRELDSGWSAIRLVPAITDCERPHGGLVLQPGNALSALVFVIAGGAAFATTLPDRVPLAAAASLIGLGSFAFHRAMEDWAGWLDTFAIMAFAALLIARNVERVNRRLVPTLALLAALVWLGPNWLDNTVLVSLIGGAGVSEVMAWRRGVVRNRALLAVVVVLYAAGLAVFGLSRTDGPWCDPDAVLQGHAMWHVLAAGVVALLFAYFASERAS